MIKQCGDEVVGGLLFGFGFIGEAETMSENVRRSVLDVLRYDVTSAGQKGSNLRDEDEGDGMVR